MLLTCEICARPHRSRGVGDLLRCPRCGGKGWFRGWFTKVERCRTCGYRYERQPGFLLGALTMNTIVTFGLLAAVLLVGSILSYPDIAIVPRPMREIHSLPLASRMPGSGSISCT